MIQKLVRRYLGLPPRRCASWLERLWLPMPDGVRLATLHFWPVDEVPAPTVLMRTPHGANRGLKSLAVLGRLIAESGYHAILQDVRGRHDSEGRFTPFAEEGADGRATLQWIAQQSWYDGRTALMGAGYSGYAAWAALAEAPDSVRALVVASGASDPYSIFYSPGGAFSLAAALAWGVGLGQRKSVTRREMDLKRALTFQPVREADRIAFRETSWYRDWVDHPRRDRFWERLRAALPPKPLPTLLLAGWYDWCLRAQLGDYANLVAANAPASRLVIGPWSHGRVGHSSFRKPGNSVLRVAASEIVAFLDHHLRDHRDDGGGPAVRFFMPGGRGWCQEEGWPPAGVQTRSLFLHGGRRNGGDTTGGGSLSWQPSNAQGSPDHYTYRPERPPSSRGDVMSTGVEDRVDAERRSDLLLYTSAALDRDLDIAGEVKLILHVASTACDTDFAAVMIDLAPAGPSLKVSRGITRARWRGLASDDEAPVWLPPGEPQRMEIELEPTAWRFRAGHRVRLQISSSDFPRFDRNPNTRDVPARVGPDACEAAEQEIYCDTTHRSQLLLPVLTS